MKNHNLKRLEFLAADDHAPIRHIPRGIPEEFDIRQANEASISFEAPNEIAGGPPRMPYRYKSVRRVAWTPLPWILYETV